MKGYVDKKGVARLFRPEKNMERMNLSMARLAMPVRGLLVCPYCGRFPAPPFPCVPGCASGRWPFGGTHFLTGPSLAAPSLLYTLHCTALHWHTSKCSRPYNTPEHLVGGRGWSMMGVPVLCWVLGAEQTFDSVQYLECIKKLVHLDKAWIPSRTWTLALWCCICEKRCPHRVRVPLACVCYRVCSALCGSVLCVRTVCELVLPNVRCSLRPQGTRTSSVSCSCTLLQEFCQRQSPGLRLSRPTTTTTTPPPSVDGYSIYIRPTAISTFGALGVGASRAVKLYTIMCPVGPYYPEGFAPVSLLAETEYVRAFPGGTGNAKIGRYVCVSVCV